MVDAYQELETIFTKLAHLQHINAFMIWDEAVMMPPGGGAARAEAMATLKGLQHETLTDPHNAELIEKAKSIANLDAWQQANLRWIEKKYKENICLPTELVKKITASSIESEQGWRQLRRDNNWIAFAPYLEKTFNLIKESADICAETFHLSPYDVLIDSYSPDLTQKIIDPIFELLKTKLPTLIESIIEGQKSQATLIPQGPFDIEKQKSLGIELMKAIGFDFNRGRLDTSHHPFCGGVSEDVRITTRYHESKLFSALLGICHETGHALYEQHLPKKWLQQPVGQALGMAVHESQSLLIEMQACRSREFMDFLNLKLQQYFGDDPAFEANNLFQLHTKVDRTHIRVDADEVTYPLHVIVRYEIEKELFKGNLKISELPEIWNAKMTKYLNLSTKGDYKNGVMQDVHWPCGAFGYFPAYTLGSLMAAQFFASAEKAYPTIKTELSRGDFSTLTGWLHKNVHEHGSSVNNIALLQNATGEGLNPDYFLEHIKRRYQAE